MKGNGWVWGSDLLILSPILRIPGCWDTTIFGIFSFCLLSIHLLSSRLATKRVLVNRNETEAAPTIITNLRILARACDYTATSCSFVSSTVINQVRLYIVVYVLLLL